MFSEKVMTGGAVTNVIEAQSIGLFGQVTDFVFNCLKSAQQLIKVFAKLNIRIFKTIGGVIYTISSTGVKYIGAIFNGVIQWVAYVTKSWVRMFIKHPGVILSAVIVVDVMYVVAR